jgi:tetratricopeptide (TPR) repeat protein
MSIRSLFKGFKNIIQPRQQSSLELLLFPEEMKDRELLRKSPYAEFFLKISPQIAGKSEQEIHSYFDQCTAQLNLEFANWLNDWGKARFANGKRYPKIEEILDALDSTWDFPRGNRASNLEISLVANQLQLLFINHDSDPLSWATIQNNRANAYLNRIKGDRAENLEYAIAGYESALEIYTKENFPIQWATTQNNRANAYSNRIKGDRAENLEYAIAGYESALEIRTKENFPIDWAMTQNNRASAYSDRIKGDRAENLEYAIECYENALPIFASSRFLQELENLQKSLANAYLQRVSLDTTDTNNLDSHNRIDKTNNTFQQLTQTCLAQSDWYKASLCLSLWSTALISQKATVQAVQPLLQAISLDTQHNHQLVDTDLQELASLMTQLDWQPEILPAQWQAVNTNPLTTQLQAQICFTIGVISIQEKYWYKGLDWLKACWEIQQTMDDLEGLAEVSYQLAIGHHIASNLSYAGIYYRDAQRLFQHLNDIRKVAFCHHGLGKLLLQMGKIEQAITEFDRALTIYNTIQDQPQVSSRISDIYYYKRIITKMQDPTLTNQVI